MERGLIDYLWAGGPVMVPIALSSVLALAAFFERLWALRPSRVAPPAAREAIVRLAREGRFDEAAAACSAQDTALTRVFSLALRCRGQQRAIIKERLEEVGRREASELERVLPVLSTVGALGPLLGLLGTVGGMIMTFESVRQSGGGSEIQELAGGIAQALVTTFSGLVVAIPAVVAHRYLLSRVDGLLVELEEASLEILEAVASESTGPTEVRP